jgi:hypothetical protein
MKKNLNQTIPFRNFTRQFKQIIPTKSEKLWILIRDISTLILAIFAVILSITYGESKTELNQLKIISGDINKQLSINNRVDSLRRVGSLTRLSMLLREIIQLRIPTDSVNIKERTVKVIKCLDILNKGLENEFLTEEKALYDRWDNFRVHAKTCLQFIVEDVQDLDYYNGLSTRKQSQSEIDESTYKGFKRTTLGFINFFMDSVFVKYNYNFY